MRIILVFLTVILTAGSSFAGKTSNVSLDETFVIETARPLSAQEMSALATKLQLRKVERLSPYRSSYFDRVYRVEGYKGQQELLQAEAMIKKVDVALPVTLQSTPDPLLGYQWHLANTGQSVFEELTDIRSKERKGIPGMDIGWLKARPEIEKLMKRDVSVAVIDSGVDYEHEELTNQLFKNLADCTKVGKPPAGVPKEDNDNNGYKGDCIGINLVPKRPENANKPLDDMGHGTHVAGSMAATPDNGIGISGLSGRIKILPIKILSEEEVTGAKPLTDRVAEGILYATSRGVDVINMSLGWPISQNTEYVHKAILEAQSKGIIIVAAAGNNSHSGPIYPCAYKKVICVGSVAVDGTLSNFSNYGPQVDIVAPGSNILSLYPKTLIPKFFSAKGYEIKSGTSQATPLVSGAAALLKGAFPNETAEQIRGRLLAATRPLPGLRTAGGLLRLDDSLLGNYRRKNSIEFKEIEMVIVKNGAISVNLPVENFSVAAAAPQASIKSAGPQVTAPQLNFSNGELQLSGAVTDFSLHHEWPVTLNLDGNDYQISLPLIRDAGISQAIPVPTGTNAMLLRTVYDLDGGSKSPQYFRLAAAETGTEVEFYEVAGKRINSLFQKILVGETKFLAAASMDLDGDSVRDFLLFTYHIEVEKLEGQDINVLKLSLHYLNRKGEGLYGGTGQLKMLEDPTFNFPGLVNFKNVSFSRYTLDNGQTIMLPSVLERGTRSPLDQSKAEKRAPPRMTSHIFYLQPVRDQNNELKLLGRTLDGADLEAELRKSLNLYYYEQLLPLMPIAQTGEMRKAGFAQYLLVAGQQEMGKNLLVTLNPEGKVTWRQIETGIGVHGYSSTAVWSLGKESVPQASTATYGLVTSYSLDGGFWNAPATTFGERFQVVNPDVTEDIARVLQIFEMSGEKYVIYESTSLLNVLRIDGRGDTSLTSALVHRSSFFSQFFSQVVSAFAINTKDGFSPGLYVDNSQINARSIQAWDIAGKSLTAPINLTLHVPEGCRALNPVQLEGKYQYVLACTGNPNLTFTPADR